MLSLYCVNKKTINNQKMSYNMDINKMQDTLQKSKSCKIPEHYMELISNAINFCKKENIEIGFQDFIKNKLKEKTLL